MTSNFDTPTPTKVPQPVGYRILIRPLPAVEKTKGGKNQKIYSFYSFSIHINGARITTHII